MPVMLYSWRPQQNGNGSFVRSESVAAQGRDLTPCVRRVPSACFDAITVGSSGSNVERLRTLPVFDRRHGLARIRAAPTGSRTIGEKAMGKPRNGDTSYPVVRQAFSSYLRYALDKPGLLIGGIRRFSTLGHTHRPALGRRASMSPPDVTDPGHS